MAGKEGDTAGKRREKKRQLPSRDCKRPPLSLTNYIKYPEGVSVKWLEELECQVAGIAGL